jgi:hypothetical protein
MTFPRFRRLAWGGVDHTAPPHPNGHASTGSQATNCGSPRTRNASPPDERAIPEPTEGAQP